MIFTMGLTSHPKKNKGETAKTVRSLTSPPLQEASQRFFENEKEEEKGKDHSSDVVL